MYLTPRLPSSVFETEIIGNGRLEKLMNQFLGNTVVEATDAWTPTLDLREYQDRFEVRVEVPGIDPKDVELTISDGRLTLKGEKRTDWEENTEGYYRSERCYGKFARTVVLPETVDVEKVSASGKNGVLVVTLPKRDEAQPRKIEIRIQ